MIKLLMKKMIMKVIMVQDLDDKNDEKKNNIMMRITMTVTPIMMRLMINYNDGDDVIMMMTMKAMILAKMANVLMYLIILVLITNYEDLGDMNTATWGIY